MTLMKKVLCSDFIGRPTNNLIKDIKQESTTKYVKQVRIEKKKRPKGW